MTRRFLLPLGLAMALLGPLAQSSLAASGPIRFPADNQPADFGAGIVCAFPVHVGIVVDHETISLWLDDQGNPSHLMITGALVLSVTNTTSGKTLDLNVPGPVQVDMRSNGSSIWRFYGPSLIGGMPAPLPNGGLYVNSGAVVAGVTAANEVSILGQHGHAADLCGPLG
jgi:hypothetical protein